MRRVLLVLALALLAAPARPAAGQDTPTETPTETPTATATATATATETGTATQTATATVAPTVADSTGLCVATGDKTFAASALTLGMTPTLTAAQAFVVAAADDPYFFLCEFTVYNQTRKPVQVTMAMQEPSGLFAPVTKTVDLDGAATATFQIPIQTWNIAPDTYQLRCLANANKANVVIVQPTSFAGAWRLGSSAAGCPAVLGGGNIDASGATLRPRACIDEVVSTTLAASVETAADLPAGAHVNDCLTRTNVAVTGGYSVGLAGAPTMWGVAAGVLGDSNFGDVTMPDSVRLISAQAVRLVSRHSSGTFQATTGRVRVVCFCDEIGAPTE